MSVSGSILTSRNLTNYADDTLEEAEISNSTTGSVESYLLDQDYEPDVISAQAFGESEDPESYNNTLAHNILAARELYGDIPVVAQAEVVNCLEDLDDQYDLGLNFEDDIHRIFETSEDSKVVSDYPTTRVLEEAHSVMKDNDIPNEDVLLTGHPAHMERIMYVAEKSGIGGEPFVRSDVSWPENDGQDWVRDPESWKNRELLSRAHHWTHYNVPGADQLLGKLDM